MVGGWLAARSQFSLQREVALDQSRQARRLAYVEFLTAFRQFRRFLQTEDVRVRLIPDVDRPGKTVPVVEGARQQWETFERARSGLLIATTGQVVHEAAEALLHQLFDLMRARATYPAGGIPHAIIREARDAEDRFAGAAHADLK